MAGKGGTGTYRAWLYSSASGGLEHAIKLSDAPLKPAGKDQILVKVYSVCLNPVDHKLPELGLLSRTIIPTPAAPCMDFSGTVYFKKCGGAAESADSFIEGETVFGRVGPQQYGPLGEYVLAKPSELTSLPDGVDLDQASCIGTAALTAYQSIAPHVKEGDKVLINGGSGGTGTFGIQIAKILGCHVTTSCSGRNVELCKSLGADEVIDYTKEDVVKILKSKGTVFKVAVDNVGSSPPNLYSAADHYLLPEGKFVQVGGGQSLRGMKSTAFRTVLPSFLGGGKRSWQFMVLTNDQDDRAKIGEWMKEGKVKAVIDETFNFEQAPKAFEKLKTGRSRGNIVIRVEK
ncbi:putative Chaperonin 10-like protein [Seiridium unicorne]|uniref:Chaperonin 10-like protein n=1 Tax=Seiridium unicorne TaxID=138068 RepID=A0ABR2UG52_9PEZI